MAAKKSKAKQWINIISPEYFGGEEIGKTLADEPGNIVGRRITVSALEISENVNKFYVKFYFKIIKVDGTNAATEFDGLEILRDYISRMVVRRVSRIDTVQNLKTSDGKFIRVKGLSTISRKAKRNVRLAVKARTIEMIKDCVERNTLDDFIDQLISDEIKNRVLQESRKIYPIRNFEVRKLEIGPKQTASAKSA